MASADGASESLMSKSAMYETFCAAIRRWRLPKVMAFFALAVVSLAPVSASADQDHRLRVMTQNLYVGSFFQELNTAVSANEFIAAATIIYQHILGTRPSERMVVIADEIAALRPDFVGLEQAAILRTGSVPPAACSNAESSASTNRLCFSGSRTCPSGGPI